MNKTATQFAHDYYFNELREKNPIAQEMARDMLTTHGAGGKFVEGLIAHRYLLEETPESIHGWDGITRDGRPVEIKMETVSTSKMNAQGSFGENREFEKDEEEKVKQDKSEIFANEKPLLLSVGTCKETGKCIYVLGTDFAKVPKKAKVWERLTAKSPRINFSQWSEYPESYKLLYLNEALYRKNEEHFNKFFREHLERMMSRHVGLDELMG